MKTTTPRDAPAQAVGAHLANGAVRHCAPHPDELARDRVISADGYEVVVTTVHAPHDAWLTGAYPVQQGYLVMICQPHFEAHSATEEAAGEQREQLVRALAGAGLGSCERVAAWPRGSAPNNAKRVPSRTAMTIWPSSQHANQ